MIFKREQLIEVIDGIHAAVEKGQADAKKADAASKTAHRTKWVAANKARVRELRDYLTRCLKNDNAVQHSEVRRIMGDTNTGYRDYVQFYVQGGGVEVPAVGYYRLDELAGLAALLRSIQGETVTTHQLKELGTHPRDLQKLFQAAVRAGAQVTK